MLCHQCGSPVQKDAETCSNCGAELNRSTRRFDIASSRGLRISQELKAIKRDEQLFPPGEKISDRFELREQLGKGAFGEVYRARDSVTETDACIKIFDADVVKTPRDQEMFLNATRAARGLTQPNLARVHDSGMYKDHPWVSMQFLEGLTLRKVLNLRESKGEHFGILEVEPAIAQIASALERLTEGKPHGNLKPENVFFLPELVKVTDFYVLAGLDRDIFVSRLGDDPYLAPEVQTRDNLDARVDVYSLGTMIGEMVFGSDYTPGSEGGSELGALDALCKRATAFDPQERYPTVSALHTEFTALVDSGRIAPSGSLAEPSVPPPSPPPAPGLPGPPKPPGPPGDLETMELDIEDEAIEIDDDAVMSQVDAQETATVEYDRDEDQELQDLLPTTEVQRETHLPPPEPRRGPAAKTAISRASDDDKSGNGLRWVVGLIVALVALFAIYSALTTPRETKDVVTIGTDTTRKAPVDVGVSDDASRVVALVDAGRDAGVSEEVVAAFAAVSQPTRSGLTSAREAAASRAEELEKEAEASEQGASASDSEVGRQTGASASPTGARAAKSKPEKVKDEPAAGTQCPSGMVLVKRKSGNHCIDVFEYPAGGVKPKTRVNWFDAKKLCAAKGKRLCTLSEWRASCGSKYPYGNSFDPDRCNTADEDGFERTLAKAGSFAKCRSRSGARDMTGNVHEWVEERRIAGGSFESGEDVASCRYSSPKAPGSSAADIGFRCCATPE